MLGGDFMTIKSFKREMIAKAKKRGGIWENFGQKELGKLKDKYNYNQYANKWGNEKEYKICLAIQALNDWACRFNL